MTGMIDGGHGGGAARSPAPPGLDAVRHIASVLDGVRTGLLLVRVDRHVEFANAEARRLASDGGSGVSVSVHERLIVHDARAAKAVQDALTIATMPRTGAMPTPVLLTRIGRRCDVTRLVLEVHGLPADIVDGDAGSCPALVALIDSGSACTDVAVDRLAASCDLSVAEREVCRALVSGRSLPDVARLRGVGLETVRTQARSIGRKTDTRSRAALVRLALLMSSPIGTG